MTLTLRPSRRQAIAALCLVAALSIQGCGGGGEEADGTEVPVPDSMSVGTVAVASANTGLVDHWYQKGTFMEINVRAYHDSDGDGVGDLNGVTQKLDYLKDLGVTGIWLMPINRTDDHDSGYIVTDHRGIETEYGTLDDFKNLLTQAHNRGIGVIIDYVPNHSASGNPLFVNAASARQSAYRNWFMLRMQQPTDWVNWAGRVPWYRAAIGYYYAAFTEGMPDFNWRNPAVVEYHKNSLRYWLNLGVDGFRFDAISRLVENGPNETDNQPESLALVRQLQQVVHEYPNRYLVCENASAPTATAGDDACGSAFAFELQTGLRQLARGETSALSAVKDKLTQWPMARMATMLANHDRFAGLRLMDEFTGDETSYRLAAASLLTLPGIPFIYYGEEIGMSDMPLASFDAGSDWPLRGPMSWGMQPSVTENTRVGPYAGYFRAAPNIATHNVQLASADSTSLWHFYRTLLNLRKASPALSEGSFRIVASGTGGLVFERRTASQSVLVAINYGAAGETLALPQLTPGLHYVSQVAQGASASTLDVPADGSSASLALPARSAQVFQVALP